jgi:hypothetical protein
MCAENSRKPSGHVNPVRDMKVNMGLWTVSCTAAWSGEKLAQRSLLFVLQEQIHLQITINYFIKLN